MQDDRADSGKQKARLEPSKELLNTILLVSSFWTIGCTTEFTKQYYWMSSSASLRAFNLFSFGGDGFCWNFDTGVHVIPVFQEEARCESQRWLLPQCSTDAKASPWNATNIRFLHMSARQLVSSPGPCYCWVAGKRSSKLHHSVFLAARSPDLNPVDYTIWSESALFLFGKHLVSRLSIRSYGSGVNVSSVIITCITAKRGHFEHFCLRKLM